MDKKQLTSTYLRDRLNNFERANQFDFKNNFALLPPAN